MQQYAARSDDSVGISFAPLHIDYTFFGQAYWSKENFESHISSFFLWIPFHFPFSVFNHTFLQENGHLYFWTVLKSASFPVFK